MLMECRQNQGLLLQQLLPSPNRGQEEEQDEGAGGCRAEDADGGMVCSCGKLPVYALRSYCGGRQVLTAHDTAGLCKVNNFVVVTPRPCKVAKAPADVGPSG